MREKAIKKNVQNPLARTGVGLDTGRMEDLGSKIAAEEAPEWAVRSRGEVVMVGGDDVAHGEGRWAVSEESGVFEEGFVGDRAVGDDDGGAGAGGEGEDGAIFGDETAQQRLHLEWGSSKP